MLLHATSRPPPITQNICLSSSRSPSLTLARVSPFSPLTCGYAFGAIGSKARRSGAFEHSANYHPQSSTLPLVGCVFAARLQPPPIADPALTWILAQSLPRNSLARVDKPHSCQMLVSSLSAVWPQGYYHTWRGRYLCPWMARDTLTPSRW
jgi:hypothetical protein